MKRWEYKVFNMSEAERYNKNPVHHGHKPKTWLDILNEHGLEGWEHTGIRLTDTSFLLKREIPKELV